METNLLMDPAFWNDRTPFVAGRRDVFGGWERGQAALEKHVFFSTSGSTGEPKWLALSKDALLVSAMAVNAHLRVDDTSCWGLVLPLHHVGGFGVVARAYAAACRLRVARGRWDARGFAGWIAAEGVTHTSLVPTQVMDLVKDDARAPACLRAVVVGGGHLDERQGNAARALGWPVLASYGMTEACSQIATQEMDMSLPYRCAPLPLLSVWKARAGEDGRLSISGPALFSGTASRTDGAWRYVPREATWFATQDLAEIIEDQLTPLGRIDALVKILGELVDPQQVERELGQAWPVGGGPGTFAVIALPDERAGNRLVLVVEKSFHARYVERALATYHVNAPGFRRISEVIWMKKIPLTDLGKVRRAELASLAGGRDQ